jgi:NAD(P)H-quinone oxidoreductase subunit 5
VLTQIISPVFTKGLLYQKWSIHFRNGLYINALFDRVVGALNVKQVNHKLEFYKDFRTKKTEASSQRAELEINQ